MPVKIGDPAGSKAAQQAKLLAQQAQKQAKARQLAQQAQKRAQEEAARQSAPQPSNGRVIAPAAPAPYVPPNNSPILNGGGWYQAPAAAPAPAPTPIQNIPSAPVEPEKPKFTMESGNGEIAAVDSTFRDQESAYKENLAKFVADIKRRKGTLQRDSKQSLDGISKNRTLGLTGVAEDFAARGMGQSGLFVDSRSKADQAYNKQYNSVKEAQTDGEAELGFAWGKEESDNTARIQAAKRDALYRLQLNNNLV